MPLSFEPRSALIPRSMIVLLRLYVGAYFLQTGARKLGAASLVYPDEFAFGVRDVIARAAGPEGVERPLAVYAWLVETVVLPNAAFFSVLVTWTELVVGASLLIGLAGRLGSVLALFLSLNYLLATGLAPWEPSIDALLVISEITLLITAAGRSFGLDQYLHSRWPHARIW